MNTIPPITYPMLLNGPLMFKSGGLGISAIRRARFLAESGGFPVILVNVFEPQLPEEVAKLKKYNRFDDRVEIRSILHDFMNIQRVSSNRDEKIPHFFDTSSLEMENDEKYPHLNHYYKDGVKIADENLGSVTNLKIISVIENRKKKYILHTNENHQVLKADLLDKDENIIRTEFYNDKGNCFLYNVQENKRIKKWVFKDRNWDEKEFASEDDIVQYWLENFNKDILENHVLISEWAYRINLIKNIRKSLNCKIAIQFHNNHYDGDRRYGEILSTLKPTFDASSELGKIIVLTHEQKIDILKSFPHLNNIDVIPHVVEKNTNSFIARDPNKVVMLSRFAPTKRIEDVISCFKSIKEKAPQAYLEVWGHGPLEKEYLELIEKNDLADSVFIMGFTDRPLEVYASASIAIFASQFEGMNMSLVESVVCGCVPVTFDFKYGPRYAVEDGHTGIITDMDNFEELADSVVLLVQNEQMRKSMSHAGVERLEKTNTSERLVADWNKVFIELEAKEGRLSVR